MDLYSSMIDIYKLADIIEEYKHKYYIEDIQIDYYRLKVVKSFRFTQLTPRRRLNVALFKHEKGDLFLDIDYNYSSVYYTFKWYMSEYNFCYILEHYKENYDEDLYDIIKTILNALITVNYIGYKYGFV